MKHSLNSIKRIGLLLLIGLSLGLGACDRYPGEQVESPREQPAGSLEEVEEATSESDLVEPPTDEPDTDEVEVANPDFAPLPEGIETGGSEPPEVDASGAEDLTAQSTSLLEDIDLTTTEATGVLEQTVETIESWQTRLESAELPDGDSVRNNLEELKTELQAEETDLQVVADLLVALGRETTQAATAVEDADGTLVQLGGALTAAGQALIQGDDAEVGTEVESEPAAGGPVPDTGGGE